MPVLVNHWAQLESRVLLVLDDYHLIDTAEIHASLSRLVEALPRQVGSSSPAGVTLHCRWGAGGYGAICRSCGPKSWHSPPPKRPSCSTGCSGSPSGPHRSPACTSAPKAGPPRSTWRRCRGGTAPGDRQLPELTGDNRHLVDYLAGEVLADQTPELRRFLLHTSVLRRMCGDLCDAVTGRERSYAVLERVESEGLPLVPLDQQRRWYRYHHLFGELLQRELGRAEPQIVSTLHRRAAGWYRRRG